MTWRQRLAVWLANLARITPVPVGQTNDGLKPVSAGSPHDRDWATVRTEFDDAREAYAKNPLARRLVGLVVAYVIGGQGIALSSKNRNLNRFLAAFAAINSLELRQAQWCEELSRAGELFISLHMQPDGIPLVRAKPANEIKEIRWLDGDYESETAYIEADQYGQNARTWHAATAAAMQQAEQPIMLHYAVNRPVGALRGASDLASILPWLRRYSRWLDDRVRLNAAMRAFLWIVRAPRNQIATLRETYRTPPESGSVLIIDRDSEEWTAVNPDLKAADAEKDGRAIRWMIAAGGPGTGLTDLGEAETANLATAESMAEQRRRFLRQRQVYFAWLLSDLAVTAYNWSIACGYRSARSANHADIAIALPDIAPADNKMLAEAANTIAQAFATLTDLLGDSPALRRLAAETTIKFAGETISPETLTQITNA